MNNKIFKISKYNYSQENSGSVICLNGLTNTMIKLTTEEYNNIFNNLIKKESFPNEYPTLYEKMKEWGFIVPKNLKELEYIQMRNKVAVFSDNQYWLTVNPTLECNFNCWYCSVTTANAQFEKRRMSDEVIEKVKNHISYNTKNVPISGVFLDWFGGEPLMYFDEVIYPIAKFAKSEMKKKHKNFTHHITTNGYLINENMIAKMKEIELRGFQITLDGDEKKHNKIRNNKGEASYKKILNNIKLILDEIPESFVVLRINYDNNTLKNIKPLFDEFNEVQKSKLMIDFIKVFQLMELDPEENELLKDVLDYCTEKNYYLKYFTFGSLGKYRSCYSDKYYHAVINYDGNVYKCTATDYSENKMAGKLNNDGTINWNMDVMAERFSKSTFDNDVCRKCKYLPLCFGPCGQKVFDSKLGGNKFDKDMCTMRYSDISLGTFLVSEAKVRKIIV